MPQNRHIEWAFPDEVAQVLGFLNEGQYHHIRIEDPTREELKALVDRWIKTKGDWRRFMMSALKAGIRLPANAGRFMIPADADRPFMVPIGADGATEAQVIFMRLILNPEGISIGGPCRRKTCRRYFARTTTHHKVYCSRRCASLTTALKSMLAGRADIHRQLLTAAEAAGARWERTPRKGINCEDWIAGEVQAWAERNGVNTREVTGRMVRGWAKKKELRLPGRS